MSQNSFHNQDLSNLIYQNQQLRLQKKQSDQLISSLENENEHLKRSIRLHRIVVRPNAKGSRTGQGKYSKRRRSNVAVIIVRIVFIGSFLFGCLLLNHSFPTNPNSITNCFELSSLLQLNNYIAPASLF